MTTSEGAPAGLERHEVAAALREIASLVEVEGSNPFRARAYERAARSIEALAGDLGPLVAEGRLTEIPGVGESIAHVVEDLVTTGRSSVLEGLREALPPGAAELSEVLGLSRIKALHDALGIETVEQLAEACRQGRVREVKGFGAKTEQKILDKIRERAERGSSKALDHALGEVEPVLERLRDLPGIERAEVAGALRRRVEVVNHAVVVVATRDAAAATAAACALPQVVRTSERSDDRVVLHLARGLAVHVLAVPADRFELALHEATGAPAHLEQLRERARARSIDPEGAAAGAVAADEHALYARLGLPYLPPEVREGAGEIEAVEGGRLVPDRLLKVEDVRGAVHCHTVYSDGTATIEEMARGAEALGLDYITITDHSPTAAYAGAMTLEKLLRQWDEIDEIQERVGIRILRGTESDILADGSLDWPDGILEKLDVIVASVHNRHALDEEAMTARLVRAMKLPQRKVWGHALGRLLLRRPPLACHVERVLDAIAEAGGIVEINGDPRRLDLEPRWVRAARERGIPFVVSSDAHSVPGIEAFAWGVAMARRGWVTREEVLNVRDAGAFLAAVRP